MTFGERVNQLRKQKKWSQDELAKMIGTSAPIVGRYERGEINPSIDTAKKIADALEVTIDFLIGGSKQAAFDRKTLDRIEEIERLQPDEKEKVYYLLDVIIRDSKARQAYA